MNHRLRNSILLCMVIFLLASCSSSKKMTKQFVDPYEGKADNELSATERYIKKYRDIAIEEMNRSGVPASITLAQGVLESGNGNSYLAKKGNNHFGIKCKGDWHGATIYFDDDQKNECFRKYNDVIESYKDHSEFLRVNTRYASLFDLNISDYKGWAKGLKAAGYATRSNYAELLIDLIEKHELYNYDQKTMLAKKSAEKSEKTDVAKGAKPKKVKSSFKYNKIAALMAQKGQTYESIANDNALEVNTLLDYNDLSESEPLKEGEIVYLRPKKTKAKESYHIVRKKDRLRSISQEYGVKLSSLYEYNMIEPGDEPAEGEIVYLKSKRKEAPELRIIVEPVEKPEVTESKEAEEEDVALVEPEEENIVISNDGEVIEESSFEEVPVLTGTEKETPVTYEEQEVGEILDEIDEPTIEEHLDIDDKNEPVSEPVRNTGDVKFHFVQKGETLYGISKTYNVSVEDIKKWNKMESNSLEVGDTLVLQAGFSKPVATPEKKVVMIEDDEVESETPVSASISTNDQDTVFHTVKAGESLYTISRKYGVTIIDLIAKNKLSKYEIESGQKLIIELPEKNVAPSDPFISKSTSGSSDDPFIKKTTEKTKAKPVEKTNEHVKYHIVAKGETLYAISRKYNMKVNRLMELNNLSSNDISIGQKLVVESSEPVTEVQTTTKPASGPKYHVVQVDETLYSISKKYNIGVERIKELNNLKSNTINVGQKLIVE